jgi:hypothetical protein
MSLIAYVRVFKDKGEKCKEKGFQLVFVKIDLIKINV